MNWLDIALLLGVAWFVLAAFSSGLLREMVGLGSVLGGVALAGLYYRELAQDLLTFTDSQATATVVAFLVIFAGVALIGQLVAYLLKGLANAMMLGWLDHLLGGVFGLAKGLALAELFLVLFITLPAWGLRDAIDSSTLAPYFLKAMPVLMNLLPEEFRAAVEAFQG